MSPDRYRTLSGDSEGLYREKASKFIAAAFPITDEEHFKQRCAAIAREHHASRHVCYAWVLGDAGERHRANDAGEPAGTAGKPILRPLQAMGLTYAAIVVVRYFGGTLLGKAGLVHAYGEAARQALAHAAIVERVALDELEITCTYAHMEAIKRDVSVNGGEVHAADFTDRCVLRVGVPQSTAEALIAQWDLSGAQVRRVQAK
ncbi:MAG: YigZ family protein [Flavobacteriales bacterium]